MGQIQSISNEIEIYPSPIVVRFVVGVITAERNPLDVANGEYLVSGVFQVQSMVDMDY